MKHRAGCDKSSHMLGGAVLLAQIAVLRLPMNGAGYAAAAPRCLARAGPREPLRDLAEEPGRLADTWMSHYINSHSSGKEEWEIPRLCQGGGSRLTFQGTVGRPLQGWVPCCARLDDERKEAKLWVDEEREPRAAQAFGDEVGTPREIYLAGLGGALRRRSWRKESSMRALGTWRDKTRSARTSRGVEANPRWRWP